jgi:hypothetical protein
MDYDQENEEYYQDEEEAGEGLDLMVVGTKMHIH